LHIPVKHITKNLAKLVMRSVDSSVLTPEISGKHTEKFLKSAENKNLLKIKIILNTEIQANRGSHYLHLACQEGGGAHPLPPVNYATPWILVKTAFTSISCEKHRSQRN